MVETGKEEAEAEVEAEAGWRFELLKNSKTTSVKKKKIKSLPPLCGFKSCLVYEFFKVKKKKTAFPNHTKKLPAWLLVFTSSYNKWVQIILICTAL